MLQGLANLIRRLRKPASTEECLPCVFSVAEDSVRVDVLEKLLPCGHCAYVIRGEFYVEKFGKWLMTADLRDFNLETTLKLLTKAQGFVSQMEHGLVSAG
jgi:hypothetical protein